MSKLVRDKIPEIIEKSGKIPIYHIASKEEMLGWLYSKLQEEYLELMNAEGAENILYEIADVYEVMLRLANYYGFTEENVQEAALKKCFERGAFTKGFILDEVKDNE